MTTSDATMGPNSLQPDADAIHRAIRAIGDAREARTRAAWEGMELLEAAYGDKAFRYEKSIFRDNDGEHGRTPRTLPRPDLAWSQPGKRRMHPRRECINASALTSDQVALLRSARIDPATGTVVAESGNPVDPQIEGAARAIRYLVIRGLSWATLSMGRDHENSLFPAPRGAVLEGYRIFITVDWTVRQLEAGDEAGAEQAVLRCAAEADDGRLAANGALATAGFLLGVTGVGWAALALAAGDRVIACNCWDCDPPEHYPPRR